MAALSLDHSYSPLLQTDIAAQKGKEFVVCFNISPPRDARRNVEVAVDRVHVEGWSLEREHFKHDWRIHGWPVDPNSTQCFTFSDVDKASSESWGGKSEKVWVRLAEAHTSYRSSTDSNTQPSEENEADLMRACVEVQFYDAVLVPFIPSSDESSDDGSPDDEITQLGADQAIKAKVEPPKNNDTKFVHSNSTTSPTVDAQASGDAASGSPEIADAVHEDSKLANLVGMQIKPGRTICNGAPAEPVEARVDDQQSEQWRQSRQSEVQASASAQQAQDQHAPVQQALAEATSASKSTQEQTATEQADSELSSGEQSSSKAVPARHAVYKEGANVYIASSLYRPEGFLLAKKLMPDPIRAAQKAQQKDLKRKKAESENVEQNESLEAPLLAVKKALLERAENGELEQQQMAEPSSSNMTSKADHASEPTDPYTNLEGADDGAE